MVRAPAAGVRLFLRREVGFSCPVLGCRSPYLTWHHFDPPWAVEQHHRLEGMVALCGHHHHAADVGAYTKEQLREFKRRGSQGPIRGDFQWRREKTLFLLGSNFYANCRVPLRVRGQDFVWLTKDENGFDLVNLDLFASDGALAFSMRDNDWVVYSEVDDLECPPAGKSLRIDAGSLAISLSLRFENSSVEDIRATMIAVSQAVERSSGEKTADWIIPHRLSLLKEQFRGNEFHLCRITSAFDHPAALRLTDTSTSIAGGGAMMGSFVMNFDVGLNIG
jgi:hypothetical protein